STWRAKTLERALSAVGEIGKWLAEFHADHKYDGTVEPGRFPFWIRPYQQASGRPFRLSESLMELGVNRIAVGTLLEKLEKVVRSVSSATQFTTVTYGDFRAWNMLIARDAAYIIDLPSELLLDTPWRDICAFLTSVDYVMARPRSFPARFMLKPRMVKSRFIRGYFNSIPLDWTAIDVMEIPAMVASWEDLK